MKIVKAVHMKKLFPHGWFAACGRALTSTVLFESSWSKVTCKNCKLKQKEYDPGLFRKDA
jgi:hypothetical protein